MEQGRPTPTSESAQPKQREIAVGTLVGGRYRVERLLGQGGFGRSYLAIDSQRFDELCVLKEFVPANQSPHLLQKAVELFKKEAKTLYQINHPQIPKFLAGFTQSQRLFIVQEYVNGTTYAQLLRQRQQKRQLFAEAEVIEWLYNLLPVLEYLHSLNLIHRDISPDNVMYSRDRGLPVLIDFGLVKDALVWSTNAETANLPRRTSMVGKFGYSPPEQLRMGHCYPCSDLYALGVTAIVLLTGKHPNALMDAETLQWDWQPYASLKTPLAQVLDKLLMPQPKARYQSARAVIEAMQKLSLSRETANANPQVGSHPSAAPAANRETPSGKQLADSVDLDVTSLPSEQRITTEEFIEQCRQELVRCVGPIASVLVDSILAQYPHITPEGFVETISSQITDPNQAIEFKRRIMTSGILNSGQAATSASGSKGNSSSGQKAGVSNPSGGQNPAEISASADAAFINCCRQELMRCIGPIASVVLKNVLDSNPGIDRRMLIEILAAQIPDAKQATAFRQQVSKAV